MANDYETLKKLLDSGPPFGGSDHLGQTPIMRAIVGDSKAAEKKRLVNGFIKGGEELSLRDSAGRSALDHAVFAGSLPLIKLLVAKGAEPNARDHAGRTALMKLNQQTSKVYKVVSLLVELGADADAQCNQGRTPMMYAALSSDHLGMSCFALQSVNARVDIVDNDGHTVIELCEKANKSMLRMLHRNLSEQTGRPNQMPHPGTPSKDGFLPPG